MGKQMLHEGDQLLLLQQPEQQRALVNSATVVLLGCRQVTLFLQYDLSSPRDSVPCHDQTMLPLQKSGTQSKHLLTHNNT